MLRTSSRIKEYAINCKTKCVWNDVSEAKAVIFIEIKGV